MVLWFREEEHRSWNLSAEVIYVSLYFQSWAKIRHWDSEVFLVRLGLLKSLASEEASWERRPRSRSHRVLGFGLSLVFWSYPFEA